MEIKMIVKKHEIIIFLIASYFITYSLLGIMIFANGYGVLKFDTPFGMLLYILGTLSPTLVAFFVLKKGGYIANLRQYMKIAFSLKQKWIHYSMVFAFLLVQYSILILAQKSNNTVPWYMVIVAIIPCIMDGGLEELGWRYILYSTLEKRFSFVGATSITAIIWILWHIPFFFIVGTAQSNMEFISFFIAVLGVSFALSAIYHITKSVWLCILYHAMFNALSFCWPIGRNLMITIINAVLMIVVSFGWVYFYDCHKT
ncbi:MAG: CPBP family intramembrane glutamic endopeptidase [Cellulosilyticaceae bacterium]